MSTMLDHSSCPGAAKHHHPDIPDGYIDRANWMRQMSKTHVQRRCPDCRRFFVWVRKMTCAQCRRPIVNVPLHMRRYHGGRR